MFVYYLVVEGYFGDGGYGRGCVSGKMCNFDKMGEGVEWMEFLEGFRKGCGG